MPMSSAELHTLVRHDLGTRGLKHLVSCALGARASAHEIVQAAGFPSEQARDVFPYVFRADFESRLSGMTLPGLRVAVNQNSRGTSSFVEVASAGVTLTALTRSHSPKRLPKALYRDSRAESAQSTLFAALGVIEELSTADRVYGVFVYGGRRGSLDLAKVFFPLPNCDLLTVPPLDLLLEHASSLDDMRREAESARPTEQAVDLALGLKRKAHDKDIVG